MITDDDDAMPPRSDLLEAGAWLVLGTAVLVASIRMDRLEDQDVPPFGAPGLLPGLLGLALLVMGGLFAARSLRRGALTVPVRPTVAAPGRALLVIGLCVLFGTVLVGHGLPFWAAAAGFVTIAILLLRQGDRPAIGLRAILSALAVGLGAGLGITLVFQQVFLVRLP